jgi:hypothetical protein
MFLGTVVAAVVVAAVSISDSYNNSGGCSVTVTAQEGASGSSSYLLSDDSPFTHHLIKLLLSLPKSSSESQNLCNLVKFQPFLCFHRSDMLHILYKHITVIYYSWSFMK